MNKTQFSLLVLISALWGSSFLFMKQLSPIFGPFLTSSLRLLVASFVLYFYFIITKTKINWKQNFKWFLVVGVLNSAVPFTLYAYAALNLDASISVILNSTAPMFGAIYGLFILKERLNLTKIVGLIIGTIGVIIITSLAFNANISEIYISIGACILASSLYGLSGNIVKKYVNDLDSKELTLGSMLVAGVLLLPFIFFTKIEEPVTFNIVIMILFFGIFCTGLTYLIYFKLVKEIGPVKSLTVTYLMPVFGILWSFLFLDENITITTIIGLVIILLGIYILSKSKTVNS